MKRVIFFIGMCSLIVACQHSPKKNYYYLSAQAAEKSGEQRNNDLALQLIGIGPVEVADYLNRSQIIDNQTDNTLNMSENAYWAEPLDKSISRVISLNLTQLNNSRSFVNFPWRNDSKPKYSLRVRVDNLARSGSNATINATWELVNTETKSSLVRRIFVRSIPVAAGAKALAQSYSQLLGDLSKEMDEALNKNNQH
jgi:uncharacterized lipoprotein YmbA